MQATVDHKGLAHDRSFMVVRPDGSFYSQRTHPIMATIRAEVSQNHVCLMHVDRESVTFDITEDGPRRAVSVFNWHGEGVDQGEEPATWFSSLLQAPCRVVRVSPQHHRVSSGLTAGTTGFSDGHAILMASESSLDNLNSKISLTGNIPIPMDRFRPNVVVSGWSTPYREDSARLIRIGDVELGYAKQCKRCTVPMVDQQTGTKSGPEPIRTLATYRRASTGETLFGMKAAVIQGGTINIGDEVQVSAWNVPH